ncbi:MAG: PAS domain-containing sensor histidine kinase [bacterium]
MGYRSVFNFVAETLTGVKASKAIGKHYSDVVALSLEENPKLKVDCIADVSTMGKSLAMSNHRVLIRSNGILIPISSSASPVRDKDGRVIGFVVILRDVTEERRVDKSKTEFVSLASHQLRTPLTSINWYSEMLLSDDIGKLSSTQHQYAQDIHTSSNRMVKLVNALLNVARLEMGVVEINPEKVDLSDIVKSCIKDLDTDIFTKKLVVTYKCDKAIVGVCVDVKILTIILQNFLSNSVKYCKIRGNIHVSITKDKSLIVIAVSDNGIGIPKDQQKNVFTKLFRADNARFVDSDGSGLGLYIVSEILRQIDGKVWFKSSLKKGTTFFASLPIVGRYRAGNKGLV